MDERRRQSAGKGRITDRQLAAPRDNQRKTSGRTSPNQNRKSASHPSRRNRKSKRRRRVNLIIRFFSVFSILAVLAFGAVFFIKYGPSKEQYDLDTYFGISSDDEIAVIIDDEVIGPEARKYDGHLYVSYETVRDHINGRFYWDSNENILRYTLPAQVISADVGKQRVLRCKCNSEQRIRDCKNRRTKGVHCIGVCMGIHGSGVPGI